LDSHYIKQIILLTIYKNKPINNSRKISKNELWLWKSNSWDWDNC